MLRGTGHFISRILGFAIAGLLCLAGVEPAAGQQVDIAIIASDSTVSTERTLYGIKKVVSEKYPEANFNLYQIDNEPLHRLATVNTVKQLEPSLIITIGSSATGLAKEHFSTTPIVFSSVKYPVLSGFVSSADHPGGNITGASLDIPTDVQLNYFKKIIPNLEKVGVLYTDATKSLIVHARIVAQSLGLEMVAVNVASEKDLPQALDSLARTVQGIWSVADPNLFQPQSTRYILLHTVRRGIPFMGFSRFVVESGALCALDFDYKAVGLQAGEIATRILSGEKPGNIEVTVADVIWFHYNEKTAQRIAVEIPSELASIAKEVFR